jgi:hypothetical protein
MALLLVDARHAVAHVILPTVRPHPGGTAASRPGIPCVGGLG